jgi:hypothetical protein
MGRRRPISVCFLHLAARILRSQGRKKKASECGPGAVC